ncbi:MAG: hypothetical protein COB14_01350 [Alphaproteobacteria bacterium]|nr:MAG: hypothetical protein COB14_01350 [Alphaproteobacteria bacterium]
MALSSLTTQTLKRGACGKCPACGIGRMLHNYIAPLEKCTYCNLTFAPLRADDGPAWVTILITGHLSMPFVFWLLDQKLNNTTLEIIYALAFILLLSALILPRAKGVFMAIIWMMHVKKENDYNPQTEKDSTQ